MTVEGHADVVSTVVLMGRPFYVHTEAFSLAEALDVQDAVAARLEAPLDGLAGYKIAWNAPHLMEAFGMPHPGTGRVFKKQLQFGEGKVALDAFRGLFVEAEIVAFLGKDITPGQSYDAQSVRPFVRSFAAGFEVLDKFGVPEGATTQDILAHNVFNAGAVISTSAVPAAEFDAASVTTRVYDGDKVVAEGTGLAPQDPFEAVAFLANHFTGRGYTLKAGEVLLCGSHMPLYPVEAPTRLGISMGGLGDVWLTVSGSE